MSVDRLDLTSDPNYTVRTPSVTHSPQKSSGNSLSSRSSSSAESYHSANSQSTNSEDPSIDRKKYVGVRFNCCRVYVRVFVNKDGTAYEGRCPKCTKPIRLKIGEGGTSCRIFDAY